MLCCAAGHIAMCAAFYSINISFIFVVFTIHFFFVFIASSKLVEVELQRKKNKQRAIKHVFRCLFVSLSLSLIHQSTEKWQFFCYFSLSHILFDSYMARVNKICFAFRFLIKTCSLRNSNTFAFVCRCF